MAENDWHGRFTALRADVRRCLDIIEGAASVEARRMAQGAHGIESAGALERWEAYQFPILLLKRALEDAGGE